MPYTYLPIPAHLNTDNDALHAWFAPLVADLDVKAVHLVDQSQVEVDGDESQLVIVRARYHVVQQAHGDVALPAQRAEQAAPPQTGVPTTAPEPPTTPVEQPTAEPAPSTDDQADESGTADGAEPAAEVEIVDAPSEEQTASTPTIKITFPDNETLEFAVESLPATVGESASLLAQGYHLTPNGDERPVFVDEAGLELDPTSPTPTGSVTLRVDPPAAVEAPAVEQPAVEVTGAETSAAADAPQATAEPTVAVEQPAAEPVAPGTGQGPEQHQA